MMDDGRQKLQKFVSAFSSQNKQQEYIDSSTPRSQSQNKLPRKATSGSYSPSPSTKRKRRLTDSGLDINCATKGIKKYITITTPNNNNSKTTLKPKERKKLSPELQHLYDEQHEDMEKLIAPLRESINLLLDIKNSWEMVFGNVMPLED